MTDPTSSAPGLDSVSAAAAAGDAAAAGVDPAALTVGEQDETVPPRPEEDEADALRTRPDPH